MATKKRQNASRAVDLIPIEAVAGKVSSSTVDLTPQERRHLRDPDWIDQQEAEAIMVERTIREEGESGTPIREYLKKRGIRVES